MAEQEENEAKIAAGFNAGYLMAEHEPGLLQQIITSANKQSEFVNAMEQGQRQQQKEQLIKQQQAPKQQNRGPARGH